jgi:alpha/beta hydrolase family protein
MPRNYRNGSPTSGTDKWLGGLESIPAVPSPISALFDEQSGRIAVWKVSSTAADPSEAGFRVVAPDMRGYGRTDRPEAIDQYTLLTSSATWSGCSTLSGWRRAVIAGHDWGTPIARHPALVRPDRFAVVTDRDDQRHKCQGRAGRKLGSHWTRR